MLVAAEGTDLIRPGEQHEGGWVHFLWHPRRLLQLCLPVVQQVQLDDCEHGTVDKRGRADNEHPAQIKPAKD